MNKVYDEFSTEEISRISKLLQDMFKQEIEKEEDEIYIFMYHLIGHVLENKDTASLASLVGHMLVLLRKENNELKRQVSNLAALLVDKA